MGVWMRFRRALIRCALRVHPPEVRREYGGYMERLLVDDVVAARRRGRAAAFRAFAEGWLDIVLAGVRERRTHRRGSSTSRRRKQPMDALRMDLRFALRSLLRRPGFTLVAILTLALGIGATTTIFSVVNAVLLRSLPYEEPERLMQLWSTDAKAPAGPSGGSVSPVTVEEWRARSRSFSALAAWATTQPTLTGMGDPEVLVGASITPDFFEVFGADPVLGRSFTAEEMLPSGPVAVVVSDGFWRDRLAARRDVLGETLELNGRPAAIIGVAPPGFDFPGEARVWVANRNDPTSCGHGCVYMNAVARLAPGITEAQARSELDAVGAHLAAEFPDALTDHMIGMASLQSTTVGDVRSALLILMAAVGMVLLIACANVANLLIARGTSRSDEIAVRSALGAGRGRLVGQLMTESLVLAVLGGGLGIGLAVAGIAALRGLSPEGIPRIDEIGIDATTLLFTFGLVLLTTLLFGFAPALRLARTSVAGTLREDAVRTVGARRGMGRSFLLAAEVGLSLVLLVGAGLLLRSFASLQRIDPGFRVDDVAHFTATLPTASYPQPDAVVQFMDQLIPRLEALPGVEDVALSVGAPLSSTSIWSSLQRTDRPAPPPGQGVNAGMRIVGGGFFELMEIGVVRGRAFQPTDRRGSQPVAVINQRLAETQFAGEDPIGKQLEVGVWMGYDETEPRTIVGVVEDMRWEGLSGTVPEFFVPQAQTAARSMTFYLRTASPGGALAAARTEVHALDPRLPLRRVGTMRELFDGQTAQPRFYLFLLAFFAVLAIALAAVGLYGVVAYLVAQRRREIGVRLALGAGAGAVVGLVLRQGLVPAGFGAALGLAGAFAAGRLMQSLLFGVAPTDPLTIAATTALLLAVVFVACLVPAARATRIPPASALRVER
jgi:putative ABC transport system permease protein